MSNYIILLVEKNGIWPSSSSRIGIARCCLPAEIAWLLYIYYIIMVYLCAKHDFTKFVRKINIIKSKHMAKKLLCKT